ncbi:heat shock protein HtpX [Methylomarinovum tepidoasis]|uniref:Protease HtpX n=1 Tax=Methylomarinovum tepidoasis TaxID=2840183 RepID=A0AAU9CUN6_9GAMM|nr:protease HtpX [Methylomarinovum sp. IN45]BCX88390.1 heat shock protein HtpX [Methylomarinovum sp. IN45]
MLRILLFVATNAAVLVMITALFQWLGLGEFLDRQGVHLNLTALLIMSALIGMTGSIVSLALSKWMAKTSMGVYVIDRPQNRTEAWLVSTVERLARQAGIGMPEVGIFPSPDPNAFATGMDRNDALVAVSTGLLETMDAEEIEAVLGHEVSHVANGDMVTLALLQGVLNTFVYFFATIIGHIVDRTLFQSADEEGNYYGYGPGYYITQMLAQIALGILATIIVMWFSRWREFRADAGGARLAGRHKMIAALEALRRYAEPRDLPGEFAAFGINGGIGRGLARLFMSHPPIEERIEALRRMRG